MDRGSKGQTFAARIPMTPNNSDAWLTGQGSGLAALFTSCAQSGKSLMWGIRKRCLEASAAALIAGLGCYRLRLVGNSALSSST
jgi:hypothetical protein